MAGALFLQANAPVHTVHVGLAEAANCGFELQPHHSYLPDTCLVTIFETVCRWGVFAGRDASFCSGIAMLEHCWTK